MTSGNLSCIEIISTADHTTNIYALDPSSAENLLADLKGTPVSSVPGQDHPEYQLLLHHKLLYTKKYALYFYDKDGVFVEDLQTKQISHAENPRFLYCFEGFDVQYSYRNPPAVKWSAGSEAFFPQKESIRWLFKKLDGQWYNSAYEPHEIIRTNTTAVSGSNISFTADMQPDSIHLTVQDASGRTVLDQPLEGSAIPPLRDDGTYRCRIIMKWSNDTEPYNGTYTCEFDLTVDLPPEFEFSNKTVTQGDVITVRVNHVNANETPVLEQSLFNPFKLYKSGDGYIGYLPTNYSTAPGRYKLRYGAEGGTLTEEYVTIEAREFQIQHLTVDPNVESSARNDAAYAQYNKYFNPVRKTSADASYYSEPFVIPAAGRLTTEFGETRYVNGAPTSYRHSGLDIAARQGTPIYAANRGKVVLSMFLTLTGNTVVIDHGQGLFSIYFHMHTLQAELGSIVERGQQIGTMGTTGFSTGSHLHFTMSFMERNIEPGYFLVGEPIIYANSPFHLDKQTSENIPENEN